MLAEPEIVNQNMCTRTECRLLGHQIGCWVVAVLQAAVELVASGFVAVLAVGTELLGLGYNPLRSVADSLVAGSPAVVLVAAPAELELLD